MDTEEQNVEPNNSKPSNDNLKELIENKIKEIEKELEEVSNKISEISSKEPLNTNQLGKFQDEMDTLNENKAKLVEYMRKVELGENIEPEEIKKINNILGSDLADKGPEGKNGMEDSNINENPENDEIEENPENEDLEESPKYTIQEWERRSGIRVLGYYEKCDEETFRKEVLGKPGLVFIIQKPGKVEKFLGNNTEAWNSIKTSISSLNEAIRNNNFPTEVDGESYILLQYDKGIIKDEDRNGEAGAGVIDEKDVLLKIDSEYAKEQANKKIEEDLENSIWEEANTFNTDRGTAILVREVLGHIGPAILARELTNGNEILEEVTHGGLDAVAKGLSSAVHNPNPAPAPEIGDPGEIGIHLPLGGTPS